MEEADRETDRNREIERETDKEEKEGKQEERGNKHRPYNFQKMGSKWTTDLTAKFDTTEHLKDAGRKSR